MNVTEKWLPITGYEGSHEISDRGRVRSLDRVTHDGKHLKGQILQPFVMPSGHIRVSPGRGGKKKTLKVHRLVLLAFVGPCPDGMEALHRDGNPANNLVENLHWGTKSENAQDQILHGVHPMKRKTHCPKGHPYSPENTYVRRGYNNSRQCRTCTLAGQRESRLRRMGKQKESA